MRRLSGIVVLASAFFLSLCANAVAGVALQPKWDPGQRYVYAGNSKINTVQEFHGQNQSVEMSTATRSEVVWEVVDTLEDGGAELQISWNWMRVEMESSTLVDPVVFDSREPEKAEGLVKETFGPLVEMIEKPIRLRVDAEGTVSIVGQVIGETPEGAPKFKELAQRSFTSDSVRALVRDMLVWVRPGEVEQGQSWAALLASGDRATCTLTELKEDAGEQIAIIRVQWAMDEEDAQVQRGPNGETLKTDYHRQTMIQAVSLDRGILRREEHTESTEIAGTNAGGQWDYQQQAMTLTALQRTESVNQESELDLDRHAQGE